MNNEMNGADWRFCKKCLVRDFDEGELFRTMRDYINRIDSDIKSPQEEYEHRLECCKQCENLLQGMCRVCGCYVEMRAAVHTNYCPAPKRRW